MAMAKTMTREERMATESIGKLMASMTLPSILAQIINILYSIIDRIYIGHMEGVGANALTGWESLSASPCLSLLFRGL